MPGVTDSDTLTDVVDDKTTFESRICGEQAAPLQLMPLPEQRLLPETQIQRDLLFPLRASARHNESNSFRGSFFA